MALNKPVSEIMLEDETPPVQKPEVSSFRTPSKPRESNWQDTVQMLYEEGASDIEICKALKFRPATFDANYSNNQAFHDLIDIGRIMAQAWWMEQGRKNVHNTKFNTTLYALIMKNRFGWAEKVESNGLTLSKDESLDSLATKAKTVLPGLLRKLHPELSDSDILKVLSDDRKELKKYGTPDE